MTEENKTTPTAQFAPPPTPMPPVTLTPPPPESLQKPAHIPPPTPVTPTPVTISTVPVTPYNPPITERVAFAKHDMNEADKPTWGGLVDRDGKLSKKEVDAAKNSDYIKEVLAPHFAEKGIDPKKDYNIDIDDALKSLRNSLNLKDLDKNGTLTPAELAAPKAENVAGKPAPEGR